MAMMDWSVQRTALNQKTVNILLCDDDPVFLERMQCEIDRIFAKLETQIEIFAFHGMNRIPQSALENCHLAFLDIDFEGEDCNGIDLAAELRKANRSALIFFVTNFIEYAPAGYEVQAFRYILKRDMEDVLQRYVLQAMEQFAHGQECLRLQSRDEVREIPLEQISYLEVMDHNVSIHAGDLSCELTASLSGLEERLASYGFLRIHKSYLVNMRCIRKLRSRECLLSDGTVLAVSERNYTQQKQKYLLWKGMK